MLIQLLLPAARPTAADPEPEPLARTREELTTRFTGLTAYDAQRLQLMATTTPAGQFGSYAIVGALALYLDFINLFLFLLRFLGSRRD